MYLLFVGYVANMVHVTGHVRRSLSRYYFEFPYNIIRKFFVIVILPDDGRYKQPKHVLEGKWMHSV
jgi:hypothetical protein